MKRSIMSLALVAAALFPFAASAAPQSVAPPAVEHFVITDNTAHVIALPNDNAVVTLIGFQNLGAAAQTATVSCWNNTAASGDLLAGPIALAAPSTVPIVYPLAGLLATNGLTCEASAAPTGGGIEVLYLVIP